jgi:serine protease AprX
MRYAIIAKNISTDQLELELRKAGATNVTRTKLLGQLFGELDEAQAKSLKAVPGLVIKPVQEYRPHQVLTALAPVETIADVFYLLRSYFNPPLTGIGLTVAILDSGIRKTHESLKNKVVFEANFSDSPTAEDIYGHGTQVAFVVAGGMHGAEEKAGVSPGASLFNIKVINDQGVGTDEGIILGIDKVCEMAEAARRQGLLSTDELYPNVINLSLGGEDDGDPDNPVRAACRQASQNYGLDVVAAAGNFGPKMTTITLPACEPEVIAVGAIETLGELVIWEQSSRGPTAQGETKPDFVMWGTNLEMASEKGDNQYVTKTGTSFAAPMLAGLTGLLWESGRRAYGEDWLFRWTQAREYAPYFSAKPKEAPVNKDNAYGYGLPAMGSMLGQMTRVGTNTPMEQTMQTFPIMLMLTLMGGLMGGIS